MIRVIVADDHPMIVEGVRRFLDRQDGMAVVRSVSDGNELIQAVTSTVADVVVLDIDMPGPGVVAVIRSLLDLRPRLGVLVLSGQPAAVYVERVLRAGALGYLEKTSLADELTTAIRSVASGKRYLSPSMADSMVDLLLRDEEPPHSRLSPREFAVLLESARGAPVKQIAKKLGISDRTVSTYRSRVLEKLGLSGQAELVRYAVRAGLIEP